MSMWKGLGDPPNDDLGHLMDIWIIRFLEPPVVIDAELMRAVLADAEDEPEDE